MSVHTYTLSPTVNNADAKLFNINRHKLKHTKNIKQHVFRRPVPTVNNGDAKLFDINRHKLKPKMSAFISSHHDCRTVLDLHSLMYKSTHFVFLGPENELTQHTTALDTMDTKVGRKF